MDSQPAARLMALDFGSHIKRLTEHFTGRAWLPQMIDAWLLQSDQRFLILAGEPGIGKSAIAARLIQIRDDIVAYNFCIAGRTSTSNPSTVLRSLAAQLGAALPGYALALANTLKPAHLTIAPRIDVETMTGGQIIGVVINHLHAENPRDEFEILLRAPLAALPAPPAPAVILIDGLDEAAAYQSHSDRDDDHAITLVNLLAEAADLPPWVRLICTTRPDRRVLRHFNALQPFVIGADSPDNASDIQEYLGWRLRQPEVGERLARAGLAPETIAGRLAKLASGNFLYTKILLDDIAAGIQPLHNLDALPSGLDEIYQRFLLRLEDGWEERYQPIMEVLAVAQEPLTEAQLAAFSGIARGKVRQYLGIARQFMDPAGGDRADRSYRLFHQSLRDYLGDDQRNQDFWCEPASGHRRIAGHLRAPSTRWSEPGDDQAYTLRNLIYHLAGAGYATTIRELLLDFGWLDTKLRLLGLAALLPDYDFLPDDAIVQRVYATLRLAGAAVSRDPAQLAGQLIGRLLASPAPEIRALVEQARAWRGSRWLCPTTPSLTPPDGPLLHTLRGHTHWVWSVAVSADGRLAVSGSGDGTLRVWDLESGREISKLHTGFLILAIALTPERAALIAGDNRLEVWDLNSGTRAHTLIAADTDVWAAAVTPDGKHAMAGLADHAIGLWELDHGRQIRRLEAHHDRITALAVTPDGATLVSGSDDRTLKIWDIGSGRVVHTIECDGTDVRCIAISSDGRQVISADAGRPKVWDIRTGELIRTFGDQCCDVRAVALTSDSKLLVTATEENDLHVWDYRTGQLIGRLQGHNSWAWAVAAAPASHRVISGSRDTTLKIWDLDRIAAITTAGDLAGPEPAIWKNFAGEIVRTEPSFVGPTHALAVTPDGRHVITATALFPQSTAAGRIMQLSLSYSTISTFRVRDLHTGVELRALEGDTNWAFALAVTPDAKYVVAGSHDYQLHVWDFASGKKLRTLIAADWVNAIAALPDSQHVVLGTHDGTIEVWNIVTGEQQLDLKGHDDPVLALIALDQRHAVSTSWDGSVRLWDLQRGMLVRALADARALRFGNPNFVRTVSITADGQRVIYPVDVHPPGARLAYPSQPYDTTLSVWVANSGAEARVLGSPVSAIQATALTPDGQRVVSCSYDGTLRVWDIESGQVLAAYTAESPLWSCAVAPDGATIIAGDEKGRVHLLRLVGG